MTNQIKNFIEEGEKEFEEKYVVKSNAGTGLLRYTDADGIKRFISSRQISLIKMIVDIVDLYTKQENVWDENSKDKFQKGALLARNKMRDTISSKLKGIIKE